MALVPYKGTLGTFVPPKYLWDACKNINFISEIFLARLLPHRYTCIHIRSPVEILCVHVYLCTYIIITFRLQIKVPMLLGIKVYLLLFTPLFILAIIFSNLLCSIFCSKFNYHLAGFYIETFIVTKGLFGPIPLKFDTPLFLSCD